MLPALLSLSGLLSVSGGLLAWRVQNRQRQPPLIKRLASPAYTVPPNPPSGTLTDEQNLVLSVSLLGLTTVGHLGFPLLGWLSTPGLLYLDFYFVRNAYLEWRAKQRVGIAANDAVLATGLVVTRQFAAGSLFATLFFASRKLQTQAEEQLVDGWRPFMTGATQWTMLQPDPPAAPPAKTKQSTWQSWIDQGALPLLTLSAISTPLLGIKRSLAILLTNFGYDYRITAPLGTLRYLRIANEQGIWLRDPYVFDQLQEIDVLVLAVDWTAQQIATVQAACPVPLVILSDGAEQSDPVTLIRQLQTEGQTVAYFSSRAYDDAADAADLYISSVQASDLVMSGLVHVILPADDPVHLQQLFVLTHAFAATQQRGFYLAFVPGLINLGGIYFGRFGVITVLLIDYGGALVGIINAVWPQLPAEFRFNRSATAPVRPAELTWDGAAAE